MDLKEDYIDYKGMKLEDHALFEITKKCNYRCKHCFTFGGQYTLPNELSTSEILSAANQFRELGFKDITFSGGDPATRSDLIEIVSGAKSLGITPHVFSTLLTEDQLDELKRYVGVFALSLDGPEKVHDAIRMHDGAYKDSMNLLGLLKEKGLNYFVQSMITQDSIDYMDWLIGLCIDYGVKGLRFSHVAPLGRTLSNKGLYLSSEQMERLWTKAQQTNKTGNSPRIFTNLVERNYFIRNRDIYNALIVHMLPNGDVVPILGAGMSWKIGNIRNQKLAEMLDPQNPKLSKFMSKLSSTYEQCEKRANNGWSNGWIPFEDILALNLMNLDYGKNEDIGKSFLSEFLS